MAKSIDADRLIPLNVSCRLSMNALAGLIDYVKLPQKQIVGERANLTLLSFFVQIRFKPKSQAKKKLSSL